MYLRRPRRDQEQYARLAKVTASIAPMMQFLTAVESVREPTDLDDSSGAERECITARLSLHERSCSDAFLLSSIEVRAAANN